MTEEKADWNEFRDWLDEEEQGGVWASVGVEDRDKMEEVRSICEEFGLIIDDWNEHEAGLTLYITEARHLA